MYTKSPHRLQKESPHSDALLEYSRIHNADVEALQQLAHERCHSAPWLIWNEVQTRGDQAVVGGGYVCIILMTQVPGRSLCKADLLCDVVFATDRDKRGIQTCFWVGFKFKHGGMLNVYPNIIFSAVLRAKIYPCDSRLENVIFESDSKKW